MELSYIDYLDVKIEIEGGHVVGFALNYRTYVNGKFHEIYRVDTAHDYLHEQKYWLSHEPIPIPSIEINFDSLLKFYLINIKQNFERYKE